MEKRICRIFFLSLFVFWFFIPQSFAQETAIAGGFEASGHVITGAGWQRFRTPGGAQTVARDVNGQIPGVIGAYADTSANTNRINKEDLFRFFVDEIELDLAKTFGNNIRFRADLDFGSATLYSGPRFTNLGGTSVFVEQAFATANVGPENGLEVLLGRFNAPIGFESFDVSANDSIARTALFRALRPHQFTGVKIYYPFTDYFGWHFYLVNNGFSIDDGDVLIRSTVVPAAGSRFDFHWGGEGRENHVGLSGVWGQDHAPRRTSWSFITDADFNWSVLDRLAIGGEVIYRQINRIPNVNRPTRNGKYYGGLINVHYDWSDLLSSAVKFGYTHDVNGIAEVAPITGARQSLTGADQQLYESILTFNYMMAEGAKLRLEGGHAFIDPSGNRNNRQVWGFGGAMVFEF